MYILFRAEGQELRRIDSEIVASDSKGFLRAKFEVDDEWMNLALKAIFEQNGKSWSRVLDDGSCLVPDEVLNTGRFKVWLIGVDYDNVIRATTESATVEVKRGPGYDAENSTDPTPEEKDQILSAANEAKRIASSVRKEADEGKFDGADGKSAYEIAVENGFEGTEEEWLESLGGVDKDAVNALIAKYLEDNEITGEVDRAEVERIVAEYLEANPPEAGVDKDAVNNLITEALKKYTPSIEEKDPTVPSWAKQSTKPAYTAEEVGARSDTWMPTASEIGAVTDEDVKNRINTHNSSDIAHTGIRNRLKAVEDDKADRTELPTVPKNVSEFTNDAGYAKQTDIPTLSDLGGITPGAAEGMVTAHNVNGEAHNDLRLALSELSARLNAALDSEDVDLNQLSEIVAYIKSNKALIEAITTSKVSVSDIIDNLTTNVSNKPLSAAQGVALKALIDALSSNKLDAAKLTEAINTALAQAKESGEFDGASADLRSFPVYRVSSESDLYDLLDHLSMTRVNWKSVVIVNVGEYFSVEDTDHYTIHINHGDIYSLSWLPFPSRITAGLWCGTQTINGNSEIGLSWYNSETGNDDYIVVFNGAKGEDGVSPAVSVSAITDGNRISITDKNGTKNVDVMNGGKGDTGAQGYSIVASVDRPSFTTANWDTYGTVGREENWGGTSNSGVRVGDIFLVAGTATDTGIGHQLVYKYTGAKGGNTLSGVCLAHHLISAKGGKGDPGKGISEMVRTSGNGAAGTTDTYTITYTDNTTSTLTVYNGKDGKNGDPYTLTDTDKASIAAEVKASLTTETWTFTLKDGSTVTKKVVLG